MPNEFKLFIREAGESWEIWVAWQRYGPFKNAKEAARGAQQLAAEFGKSEVIVVDEPREMERKG
jgi:hypothetical protein